MGSGKSSLILSFTKESNIPTIHGVTGTHVLSTLIQDDMISIVLNGKFSNPTQVIGVNMSVFVVYGNWIRSNIIFKLEDSIIEGNTVLNITLYTTTGLRLLFSNLRIFIRRDMILDVSIMLQPPISLLGSKAINFDYQTIESTEKTRNINVYANRDGGTNYYDTTMPISVSMGVMTGLSENNGDFELIMKLKNGVVTTTLKPWFVREIFYDDNKIVIGCSEARTVSLRSKIIYGEIETPPILQINPTYNLDVITIEFLGTKLSTVADYEIELSLYISAYSADNI